MNGRRCPRHPGAELQQVHGSVGARVECPECHARICQRCGEVAAECWQSSLCSVCYRITSRELDQRRREDEAARRQRDVTDAYERGRRDGAADVVGRVEAVVATWQAELDSGAIRDENARYCWGLAAREVSAALASEEPTP